MQASRAVALGIPTIRFGACSHLWWALLAVIVGAPACTGGGWYRRPLAVLRTRHPRPEGPQAQVIAANPPLRFLHRPFSDSFNLQLWMTFDRGEWPDGRRGVQAAQDLAARWLREIGAALPPDCVRVRVGPGYAAYEVLGPSSALRRVFAAFGRAWSLGAAPTEPARSGPPVSGRGLHPLLGSWSPRRLAAVSGSRGAFGRTVFSRATFSGFVVGGSLDASALGRWWTEHFSRLPSRPVQGPKNGLEAGRPRLIGVAEASTGTESSLSFAMRLPPIGAPGAEAFSTFPYLLGEGLRQGAALWASPTPRFRVRRVAGAGASVLLVDASFTAGSAARVLRAIRAHIAGLSRLGVSAEAQRSARAKWLRALAAERGGAGGLGRQLARWHALGGGASRLQEVLQAVRDFRDESWRQAIERGLSGRAAAVSVHSASGMDRRLAGRVALETTGRAGLPALVAVADDTWQLKLEGGPRLIVMRDRSALQVAIRAGWRGGLLADDPAHAGASSLLAALFSRAAERDVQRVGLSPRVSAGSGHGVLWIAVDGLAQDWRVAFQLMARRVVEPAFEPWRIQRAQRYFASFPEEGDESLSRLARLASFGLLHPFRLSLGSAARAAFRLSSGQLLAHYRGRYPLCGLVVAVVGNVHPKVLAKEFLRAFYALPRDAAADRAEGTTLPPRLTEATKLLVTQSGARALVGTLAVDVATDDVPTHLALIEALRQVLPLGAALEVAGDVLAGSWAPLVHLRAAGEQLAGASAAVHASFDLLQSDLPAAAFLRLKERIAAQHRNALFGASGHAACLLMDALRGRPMGSYRGFPSAVAARVTPAAVAALARRVLRSDRRFVYAAVSRDLAPKLGELWPPGAGVLAPKAASASGGRRSRKAP